MDLLLGWPQSGLAPRSFPSFGRSPRPREQQEQTVEDITIRFFETQSDSPVVSAKAKTPVVPRGTSDAGADDSVQDGSAPESCRRLGEPAKASKVSMFVQICLGPGRVREACCWEMPS